MSAADQCSSPSIAAGGWEPDGDHALRHPTGWTIARYKTGQLRVYLLWSPANTAMAPVGMEKHGPFESADAAKQRHAELTGARHG
jgi:hypothetical protein